MTRLTSRHVHGNLLLGVAFLLLVGAVATPAGAADILCASCGHDIDETRLATFGGHTLVNTFDGCDAGEWTDALAGDFGTFDAIVIGEDSCEDELGSGVQTAIADYVSGGGCVIVTGDHEDATLKLNAIFGYSTSVSSEEQGNSAPIQAGAAGTPFAGGPGELVGLNGSEHLTGTPGDVIYADEGDVYVFAAQFGSGSVVYLSWDLCECDEPSNQQDDWYDVLDRALAFCQAVPSLPTGGLVVLAILVVLMGVALLRRRKVLSWS